MKNYTIDLTGVRTREELHDRLFKGLENPETYGRNLDALHDVLTSMAVPCRLTFHGYGDAVNGPEESYVQIMKKVCEEAAEEVNGIEVVWEDEERSSGEKIPAKVRPGGVDPTKSPFYKMCFVCGPDNPDGLHLQLRYMDGRAYTEFTPEERMIGLLTKKGSLMHGGFTSMIFDEVMTYVMMGRGLETVTLNMSIDYVSPARTGHLMKAEAWLERSEKKKLWAAAAITDLETGETVAKATGLYYQVDLKEFIDGID